MAQLKWWLGVVSAVGLVSAGACSSDPNTGTPIPGQAGSSSSGAGTGGAKPAGGAGTTAAGGSAGSPSSGGASGGTGGGGVMCDPDPVEVPAGGSSAAGTGGAGPAPVCVGACPTKLTSVAACGSMHLAVFGGNLYFTDTAHGLVKSIPTAGGTETVVAMDQKKPYAIAADASGVYWTNTGTTRSTAADNSIMMKAPTGTPTKVVDIDQTTTPRCKSNFVKAITLDGKGNLYYGVYEDLMRVETKAAATPVKIGTFEGGPEAILLAPAAPAAATRIFTALDIDNAVQWHGIEPGMSGCIDPVVRPKPVDGETPAQATARANAGACAYSESVPVLYYEALSLAGKEILFVDGSSIQMADTTIPATMEVMRYELTETEDFAHISGFTNTATTVYFGEDEGGIISKVTIPSTPPAMPITPTIIVTDPAEIAPSSFVNDGTNMYWRTGSKAGDTCSIMKMAL